MRGDVCRQFWGDFLYKVLLDQQPCIWAPLQPEETIRGARRGRTRVEVRGSNTLSGIIIPAHASQDNLK